MTGACCGVRDGERGWCGRAGGVLFGGGGFGLRVGVCVHGVSVVVVGRRVCPVMG